MAEPEDFKASAVSMILGAKPCSGELFSGGPILSPVEQIEVYREQYRMRLWDALTEEVPGLVFLLGDEAEAVLWAYLDENPPDSWTLARVADRLGGWLVGRGPPERADMARLERAVQEGFVAADGLPLPPDAISAGVRLKASPHVRVLRLSTSVHRTRSAVVSGEPAPPLEAGDFRIATFRVERRMRHIELDEVGDALLRAFGEGAGVEDALVAAVAEVGDADRVVATVGPWLRRFVERGMLGPVP